MSREELIERICPFDIACMCHSLDDNSINCSICKEELNKVLDEYDAKVRDDERAKVIDEILFRISKITTYYAGGKDGKAITPVMFIRDEVVKTVEQMRGEKRR